MARIADEFGQPIVRALRDAPEGMRPLGGLPRGLGRQQRRNNDGVTEIDEFRDAPDTPNAPHVHRPGDGDGSNGNPDPNRPLGPGEDRGDGRDINGHFVGSENRPWADREQIGLDRVSERRGVDVIRDQVASRHPSTGDQRRFYDGLYENADGTYTGIEVKSGGATRNPAQQSFDNAVSPGNPATAILNGETIAIVEVILEQVK